MSKKNNKLPPTLGVFATPFYRSLAGHSSELSALKSYLLSRTKPEHAHHDSPQASHTAVFESSFDFFKLEDAEAKLIRDRLYKHLMIYLADVSGFDGTALQKIKFRTESWYHVTNKGGYFQPHIHPLASVSLIYCVDPGDESIEEDHESGKVFFTDPRQNAAMYLDPANRHMHRPYSFDALRFRLLPDEVCIFPSYLQHSVEPYVGERPRITIAANFSFTLT